MAFRTTSRSPIARIIRVLALSFVTVPAAAAGLLAVMWVSPETQSLFSTLFGDRGTRVEDDIAYGAHPRQKLDVYRPPAGTKEHAAVILFLYGGSWTSGSKATYAFAGKALAARGFVTVVADYRLYPEVQFPEFFDDAAAAYAWTERTLARGCPPARPVIVAGHSAGGHMAAMLALNDSYIKAQGAGIAPPVAFIGLAGPYTFEPTTWASTKDAFATAAATPDAPRPITFVKRGAPPALLLHGLADDLVNLKNTRELAAALESVGTPVETAEYANIGHIGIVLAIARPFRWRAPVLDAMAEYAARFGNADAACQSGQTK